MAEETKAFCSLISVKDVSSDTKPQGRFFLFEKNSPFSFSPTPIAFQTRADTSA